jgi:DNA-binding HxlR family transcriptional regulator
MDTPYRLHEASHIGYCQRVPNRKVSRRKVSRRSSCPINAAVEIFGDRWSLLIIRDLMFRNRRTFKEFLESEEGIATNVLADRLKKLEASGIITTRRDPRDGRKSIHRLTQKGIDLAPILVAAVAWASRYERTPAPTSIMKRLREDPDKLLADVRERWADEASSGDRSASLSRITSSEIA